MGAIRAGGIMSGLDTNSIIEQLVQTAKEPVTALNNKAHLVELTKGLFTGLNSSLTSLKNSIFTLKLESTFKAKNANVSNPSVASVSVTSHTPVGNYLLDVKQVAKPSTMTSMLPFPDLYASTSGLRTFSGNPAVFEQMEGDYKGTVTHDGAIYRPRLESNPDTETYTGITKMTFLQIDRSFVNAEGKVDSERFKELVALEPTLDLTLDISSIPGAPAVPYTVSLNINTMMTAMNMDIDDLNIKDFEKIQDYVNAEISSATGLPAAKFLDFNAEFDTITRSWSMAVYDTENTGVLFQASAMSPIARALGMAVAPTQSSFTGQIPIYSLIPEDPPGSGSNRVSDSYVVTTEFTPLSRQLFSKQTGQENISEGLVDEYGALHPLFNLMDKKLTFAIEHEGRAFNISVDIGAEITWLKDAGRLNDASDVKEINHLMSIIDEAVNYEINAKLATTDLQYVAMRADYVAEPDANNLYHSQWTTAIYDVSVENKLKITAVGGNFADAMGMSTGLDSNLSATVTKYQVAETKENLQAKLASGNSGVIYNVPGYFFDYGLKEGTFDIHYDASMSVKQPRKTTITSGTPALVMPTGGIKAPLDDSTVAALRGSVTINDKKIDFSDYASLTVNGIMGMVNGANAGVVMTYNEADQTFKLEAKNTGPIGINLGSNTDTSSFLAIFGLTSNQGAEKILGSDEGRLNTAAKITEAGFTAQNGITQGVFTINDVPIYLDVFDTVNGLMDKINTSGANVTITYDNSRDKFIVTSNSGVDRIKFGNENDSSSILRVMGLISNPNVPAYMGTEGQQAIIDVNGQRYYRDGNTIDDIVDGMTISLSTPGVTAVNVTVNTSAGVDALAKFIAGYNSMVKVMKPEDISAQERDDYMTALTENKRASMTIDEISEYNQRYDSYHLRDIAAKSSEVRATYQRMRSMLLAPLNKNTGTYHSLRDFGLDIAGGSDFTVARKGFMLIESTDFETIRQELLSNDTLMIALESHPNEVFKFFGGHHDETIKDVNNQSHEIELEDSWARNFEKLITSLQDMQGYIGVKTRVNSSLDRQLAQITSQIGITERRAEDYLERLWQQFTFMETQIAQTQSQSQYIAQMASGGSSSGGAAQ